MTLREHDLLITAFNGHNRSIVEILRARALEALDEGELWELRMSEARTLLGRCYERILEGERERNPAGAPFEQAGGQQAQVEAITGDAGEEVELFPADLADWQPRADS